MADTRVPHIDLDQSFASIEKLPPPPEPHGNPTTMGGCGDPTKTRTGVATASLNARELSRHTGMPMRAARPQMPGRGVLAHEYFADARHARPLCTPPAKLALSGPLAERPLLTVFGAHNDPRTHGEVPGKTTHTARRGTAKPNSAAPEPPPTAKTKNTPVTASSSAG